MPKKLQQKKLRSPRRKVLPIYVQIFVQAVGLIVALDHIARAIRDLLNTLLR